MNIALVIFPFHPSHGCILQTYALYTKLKGVGHTVTIINRKTHPVSLYNSLRRAVTNLKCRLQGSYFGPIFYLGNSPKAVMRKLQPFIDTYFGNDVVTVYSKEEAARLANHHSFDAFVVGSDQVWRPKYVPDIYHYYLNFVPENIPAKRIAYAPSFGTEDWEYNEEQHVICQKLIRRFKAISVREKSGVSLCKKYFDIDAECVLDPTLLLTKEDYLKVLDDKVSRKEKILSYYFLDETVDKIAFMNSISKHLGLKSHRINTKTEDANARLKDRIAPSIEKWLGGFAKSEFVIVDSFHAMVFAIVFNVPFIVVANAVRGLARFTSLLDLLGLSDRLVTDVTKVTFELLNVSIDWNKVNETLIAERNRCISFLQNALHE